MTFRDDRVAVHQRADDLARELQQKELELAAAKQELAVAKDALATAGIAPTQRPGSLALHRVLDHVWILLVLSGLMTLMASLQSERLGMSHSVHTAALAMTVVGLRVTRNQSIARRLLTGFGAGIVGVLLLSCFFGTIWRSL